MCIVFVTRTAKRPECPASERIQKEYLDEDPTHGWFLKDLRKFLKETEIAELVELRPDWEVIIPTIY